MKLRFPCGVMLGLLFFAPVVRAQVAEAPSDLSQNAALQYWLAFTSMPQTEADLKLIENWKQAPLDGATEKLLQASGASLGYLHAGAQKRWCNWGGDVNEGPYLLLRHLNRVRNLSRLACLRIRDDLAKKQWTKAADDTADDIAVSRHIAQEPIAISRLVAFACEREAVMTIAAGLNQLDAESLARLGHRLDQMPPTSTEGECLQNEARMTTGWTIQKVKDAGGNPDWHRVLGFLEISEGAGDNVASVDSIVKASGGTAEGVIRQLEGLLPYYDEAVKLEAASLTQSEFTQKATALRQRFDTNPFAKPILPNLPAIHNGMIAAQTRVILLKAAIAVVQRGPDAVKEFQDPVNHQSLTFEKRASGFQLSSKILYQDQSVTITVGP